jgi:DNA topoisomerase-1
MEGFLKESVGFQHILDIGPEKSSIKKAPKPFNTSRLLQVASSMLKSSPKQTMQTCQELYQNGYITYMRTENTKYSPIFLDQARRYIETTYQDIRYIGILDAIENKDANNPHEAIRCTNISLRELTADLNPRSKSMYSLIWRNTVESCMSDAQYKTQCASVSAPQKHTYQRILEIPVFLGWKKVGLERGAPLGSDKKPLGSDKKPLGSDKKPLGSDKKPLDDDSATLFYLQSQKGAIMSYTHIESKIQIRGKKTHYTESGLIQELEELGIGRPSTFSLLVDTVQDRGYVKCQDIPGIEKECTEFILQSGGVLDKQVVKKELGGEKQKLRIQPVGTLCIEFLIEHFGSLFSYDYTKLMEEQLDSIAKDQDSTTSSHTICLSCDQTIDTLSKMLSTMKRQEIAIDASNVFVMTRQGPAIRSNEGVYASINPDLNLDIDKLKRGEYTLDNLVIEKCRELGVYQDSILYLKTGKYGPYLEWCKGSKKQSIRTLESCSPEKITLEIATEFLDKQQESTADEGPNKRDAPTAATSILRAINTDASVRQGKFGPYIFYKTESMKKPQFVPLRGFKGEWKTCTPNTLLQWIQDSIGKAKTGK